MDPSDAWTSTRESLMMSIRGEDLIYGLDGSDASGGSVMDMAS